MKISAPNMVISIAAGLIAFGLGLILDHQGGLSNLISPAVIAILWAYFAKSERKEAERQNQK